MGRREGPWACASARLWKRPRGRGTLAPASAARAVFLCVVTPLPVFVRDVVFLPTGQASTLQQRLAEDVAGIVFRRRGAHGAKLRRVVADFIFVLADGECIAR